MSSINPGLRTSMVISHYYTLKTSGYYFRPQALFFSSKTNLLLSDVTCHAVSAGAVLRALNKTNGPVTALRASYGFHYWESYDPVNNKIHREIPKNRIVFWR
jgi:hypothetical protein